MPISSPYNFVPLNEHVFIPEWGKQVSHDLPFREGESGVIDVEFCNITPLFVRGAAKGQKKTDQPASFIDENGNKCYFIPGSSLRGMLRSVMEILSFGRLSQINKGHFGYRDFRNNDYKQALQCVHAGWLRKDKDDNGKLKLTPCLGEFTVTENVQGRKIQRTIYGFKTVTHEEIEKKHPQFRKVKGNPVDQKQKAVGGFCDWTEMFKLICTGPMFSKKHEYLFATEEGEEIVLPEPVQHQFLEVQKTHPLFDSYFLKRLNGGGRIPVFYATNMEGTEILHVGLTRTYRVPFRQGVKDGVPKSHELSPDLCELVFGRISKEGDALKGRVVLGHAFPISEVDETQFKKVSGILGEPRASFYPYYLAHNGTDYNTYNTSPLTLAGRKRYRIHTGNTTTDLPQGNKDEEGKTKNEDVITKFNALHEGITFGFRIMVHNLLPQELGALLSALTLHQQKGVYHNLGMAKGYGYGKLKLTEVSLNGFKYDKVDRYLEVFEEEMSRFTYQNNRTLWKDSRQVRTLLNIAAEHTDEEVEMMKLEEYTATKNRQTREFLSEKEYHFTPYYDTTSLLYRFKVEEYRPHFVQAKQLLAEKKYLEALHLCDDLDESFRKQSLAPDAVNELRSAIEAAKQAAQALQHEEEETQKLQEVAQRSAQTFASLLEENVNGKYKVTTLKVLLDKVKRRCKDKGCSTLDEQDVADLKATLDRLEQKPDRKEKSAWANRESVFWKYLTEVLGASLVNDWFAAYNPQ